MWPREERPSLITFDKERAPPSFRSTPTVSMDILQLTLSTSVVARKKRPGPVLNKILSKNLKTCTPAMEFSQKMSSKRPRKKSWPMSRLLSNSLTSLLCPLSSWPRNLSILMPRILTTTQRWDPPSPTMLTNAPSLKSKWPTSRLIWRVCDKRPRLAKFPLVMLSTWLSTKKCFAIPPRRSMPRICKQVRLTIFPNLPNRHMVKFVPPMKSLMKATLSEKLWEKLSTDTAPSLN
mmetsp:Transcript_22069/g.46007  ORF Transcript_22069/g.46007 Transcript_22069/m.46007 type:complete len:234 (-) Transcript_22069:1201-1902(-)